MHSYAVNLDDFPGAGKASIGGHAAAKGGALVVAGYLSAQICSL